MAGLIGLGAASGCLNPSGTTITVYVDQAYSGSYQNGDYLTPFTTISKAISSLDISDSAFQKIIHVFPGSYTEDISLQNAKRLKIEGGSSPFTLNAFGTLSLANSEDIELNTLKINSSAAISLNATSVTGLQLNNLQITSTGNPVSVKNGTLEASSLTLSTTSTTYNTLSIDSVSSANIDGLTATGGSYSVQVKNSSSTVFSNVNLSGFATGGFYIQDVFEPEVHGATISNVPLSGISDAAGIYLLSSDGGKFDDITITGGGTGGADEQNGFSVYQHNVDSNVTGSTLRIDRVNISSCGRAGIYFNTVQKAVISNFTISSSRRGIWMTFSNASPFTQDPASSDPDYHNTDIYKGTIDSAILVGLQMDNFYSHVDFLTVQNTTGGPAIGIINTVTNIVSDYFIGNGTILKNNAQQAILVSGSGYYVSITNTFFENNAGYAIEAPVQSDPSKFFCQNNHWTSQTLQIHPNLTGNANNECNL